MAKLSIQLSDKTMAALQRRAEQTGKTINEIIVEIVERELGLTAPVSDKPMSET